MNKDAIFGETAWGNYTGWLKEDKKYSEKSTI